MGTETTKVALDLDNEDFVAKLKDSLGLLGDLGSGEGMAGLTESLIATGAVLGVVAVAFAAVKVAIDLTEEAEHIKQVNATFELLAGSAGLAANVIKDQLITAAGGMIGTTEILQAANKAMVTLGDNASKMPEIMELARKVTAVMGGDLTETFEGLSRAMSTGNARMLKQYGLIVDTTKANHGFAESIGVGVDYLDAAGKKQAIFNAAMDQAHTKFDNVDVSITATSNSMKKIGTSFTEIKEIAILAWDAVAGPTVVKMVTAASDVIHGWAVSMKSMFGSGKEQSDATAESLERQISQYKTMIAQTDKAFNPGQYAAYTMQLQHAEAELAKINKQQEHSIELEAHKAQAESKGATAEKKDSSQFVDTQKLLKDKQKFEADILKLHQDRVKADEGLETNYAHMQELRAAQELDIKKKANLDIAKQDKAFNVDHLTTQKQHDAAVVDIRKKSEADIKKLRLQSETDEITVLKNIEAQNKKTTTGMAAGWKKMGVQADMNFKDMAALGEKSATTLSSSMGGAFKSIGDGSKNAADALKGAMFSAIGSIAEQEGEYALLAGIATYDPVQAAEGAALIALGSAISAMGSSSGSSSASGGGGSSSAAKSSSLPAPANSAAAAPAPAAAQPTKHVAINIQGSLFETDQTRQRLMSMIREAGDFSDFNLKQVGQP